MNDILKEELKKIKADEKVLDDLKRKTSDFCQKLEKEIKKKKIKAGVFVGGSLAKGTLLKRERHDIDIFVRFDRKYNDENISEILGRIVRGRRIHGSRDYFQIKKGKIILEIVPVIKISKPGEARNVTDLSYFHVKYVKNKTKNEKIGNEILLAKSFCHAQNVYGAESYIKGFSGYALELLVIYYKGFLNFIKAIARMKEQAVIDSSKHYKNKKQVMLEMNEAKLLSPIILVDPTFKERNALAGLSSETFARFQKVCREFLRKPRKSFFEAGKINKENYNLILRAGTNRQAGDIAGSKLLKFQGLLREELEKRFDVSKTEFEYNEKKEAKLYFRLKPKKEIIIAGPPVNSRENAAHFRKKHKHIFKKNSRIYAREKGISIREFLNIFRKNNRKKMKDIGIIGFKAV